MDYAENVIENSINLNIIPIIAPTITFVTEKIFSDEREGLIVRGAVRPEIKVLLTVYQIIRGGRGEIQATGVAQPDEKGNWEFTFNEPLRNDRYVVVARSQDVRGALSLEVESSKVSVKSKPIIQVGAFELGTGGTTLLLLLILVGGFGGGAWFYKKQQEKLFRRVGFTGMEITKIFKLINDDINRLSEALQTPTAADDEYAFKRLRENLQKMEMYLKKGVEKIKE